MKKLKKVERKDLNTIESISNICACSSSKCSHGCNSDSNVYDAYSDYYNASRLYAVNGIDPTR